MRKVLVSFIAGVVVASAGVATAASTRVFTLHSGDRMNYAGLICLAKASAVMCTPNGGNGYAVGVSLDYVIVMNSLGKVVFTRVQP